MTELRNWLDEEEGRRQEKNNNTEVSCWEGAARALVLSISGQKLGWFSTHIHAFSQLWPWHPWQCLSAEPALHCASWDEMLPLEFGMA